jgi:hypothetical protein
MSQRDKLLRLSQQKLRTIQQQQQQEKRKQVDEQRSSPSPLAQQLAASRPVRPPSAGAQRHPSVLGLIDPGVRFDDLDGSFEESAELIPLWLRLQMSFRSPSPSEKNPPGRNNGGCKQQLRSGFGPHKDHVGSIEHDGGQRNTPFTRAAASPGLAKGPKPEARLGALGGNRLEDCVTVQGVDDRGQFVSRQNPRRHLTECSKRQEGGDTVDAITRVVQGETRDETATLPHRLRVLIERSQRECCRGVEDEGGEGHKRERAATPADLTCDSVKLPPRPSSALESTLKKGKALVSMLHQRQQQQHHPSVLQPEATPAKTTTMPIVISDPFFASSSGGKAATACDDESSRASLALLSSSSPSRVLSAASAVLRTAPNKSGKHHVQQTTQGSPLRVVSMDSSSLPEFNQKHNLLEKEVDAAVVDAIFGRTRTPEQQQQQQSEGKKSRRPHSAMAVLPTPTRSFPPGEAASSEIGGDFVFTVASASSPLKNPTLLRGPASHSRVRPSTAMASAVSMSRAQPRAPSPVNSRPSSAGSGSARLVGGESATPMEQVLLLAEASRLLLQSPANATPDICCVPTAATASPPALHFEFSDDIRIQEELETDPTTKSACNEAASTTLVAEKEIAADDRQADLNQTTAFIEQDMSALASNTTKLADVSDGINDDDDGDDDEDKSAKAAGNPSQQHVSPPKDVRFLPLPAAVATLDRRAGPHAATAAQKQRGKLPRGNVSPTANTLTKKKTEVTRQDMLFQSSNVASIAAPSASELEATLLRLVQSSLMPFSSEVSGFLPFGGGGAQATVRAPLPYHQTRESRTRSPMVSPRSSAHLQASTAAVRNPKGALLSPMSSSLPPVERSSPRRPVSPLSHQPGPSKEQHRRVELVPQSNTGMTGIVLDVRDVPNTSTRRAGDVDGDSFLLSPRTGKKESKRAFSTPGESSPLISFLDVGSTAEGGESDEAQLSFRPTGDGEDSFRPRVWDSSDNTLTVSPRPAFDHSATAFDDGNNMFEKVEKSDGEDSNDGKTEEEMKERGTLSGGLSSFHTRSRTHSLSNIARRGTISLLEHLPAYLADAEEAVRDDKPQKQHTRLQIDTCAHHLPTDSITGESLTPQCSVGSPDEAGVSLTSSQRWASAPASPGSTSPTLVKLKSKKADTGSPRRKSSFRKQQMRSKKASSSGGGSISPKASSLQSPTASSPPQHFFAKPTTAANSNKTRIAVVISIGRYEDPMIPLHVQADTDGKEIAELLSDMGFVVHHIHPAASEEAMRPTTKKAIMEAIEAATSKCSSSHDNNEGSCSIVYFAGAGYIGPIAGVPPAAKRKTLTTPTLPTSSSATVLLPSALRVSEVNSDNVLTLQDLEVCSGNPSAPPNLVFVDAFAARFLPPCSAKINGFCCSTGRKCIGSELFALYSMRHTLLYSFFLKRALSGFATRDSRLSVNALNSFVLGRLKSHGLEVDSNASNFFIGDLDLATVAELKFCRMEIKEIKQVINNNAASFSVRLVPLRNQDPMSSEFVESFVRRAWSVAEKDIENPVFQCLLCIPTNRYVCQMRSVNPEKVLANVLTTTTHEIAAVKSWQERYHDFSITYSARHYGLLFEGVFNIPGWVTRQEFHQRALVDRRNSKKLHCWKNKMMESSLSGSGSSLHHAGGGAGGDFYVTQAGYFADTFQRKLDVAGIAVHNVGQEVLMTFITTEYLAEKLDLSFRAGYSLWNDIRVEQTEILLLDSKDLRLLRAASKIQALVRGVLHRNRLAPLLRCLREEVKKRAGLLEQEAGARREARCAEERDAQSVATLHERLSRSDLLDAEREEFLDVLHRRIYAFKRAAIHAVKVWEQTLTDQDALLRREMVCRRSLFAVGVSKIRFLRLKLKLELRETSDRLALEAKEYAAHRQITSQHWRR